MPTVKDEIEQVLTFLSRAQHNKFIKNIVLDPDAIFRLLEDAWDTIDDLEHTIANYEEEGR